MSAGPYQSLFNFRRKWKLVILLTTPITLVPLLFMTWLEYDITLRAVKSEIRLQTVRNVSKTHQAVSYFLSGHLQVMDFIIADNPYSDLCDPKRLQGLLEHLRTVGVGGVIDIGVIDASGRQQAYAGPFGLDGANYCDTPCFQQVVQKKRYISDLMIGSRRWKHLVMAVKQPLPDGSFFVLRATLDASHIHHLLEQLETDKNSDAFLVNTDGRLQTASRLYGDAFEKLPLPAPPVTYKARVFETTDPKGLELLVGYVYIPNTSFILMVVDPKARLMKPWRNVRLTFFVFLFISIVIILCVILGMATYLVNKIYTADQKRVAVLHDVEYSNKIASIGRLASGVAHEINNPLAVINEKAGLIKDIFSISDQYQNDPKLMGLVDVILDTIKRCRGITGRLLNFARHMEINLEVVDLHDVIHEIMGFLKKDAEDRGLTIVIDIPEDLPPLESDQGNVHQIFLNIINNAFAALDDGGRLEITIRCEDEDVIVASFKDSGCGIAPEDLKRVFDPFFTTRDGQGATGLGLSLTYGMVEAMGGAISVDSKLNEGSCFEVRLPVKLSKN